MHLSRLAATVAALAFATSASANSFGVLIEGTFDWASGPTSAPFTGQYLAAGDAYSIAVTWNCNQTDADPDPTRGEYAMSTVDVDLISGFYTWTEADLLFDPSVWALPMLTTELDSTTNQDRLTFSFGAYDNDYALIMLASLRGSPSMLADDSLPCAALAFDDASASPVVLEDFSGETGGNSAGGPATSVTWLTPPTPVIDGPAAFAAGDVVTFDAGDTFDVTGEPMESYRWASRDLGVQIFDPDRSATRVQITADDLQGTQRYDLVLTVQDRFGFESTETVEMVVRQGVATSPAEVIGDVIARLSERLRSNPGMEGGKQALSALRGVQGRLKSRKGCTGTKICDRTLADAQEALLDDPDLQDDIALSRDLIAQ